MALSLVRFRILIACLCMLGIVAVAITLKTYSDLLPLPHSLDIGSSGIVKPGVVDRNGKPLSVTYLNPWNTSQKPLYQFPDLLVRAFVESEDRRFYRHGGVDWLARAHALARNILAGRAVRGASTISEQVIRMLHPRPRTVWSRWVEGVEAARLEERFSKSEILEFYLNQVPYAHQRRGVAEAARFYFDRELETLNARETLALVVIVRAPSRLDLKRAPKALEKSIFRLAQHMHGHGYLSDVQHNAAITGKFEFSHSDGIIEASHFVQHVLNHPGAGERLPGAIITSSLDGALQQTVRGILDSRLTALRDSDVGNGAVLVVDNATCEVLAWVSGSASGKNDGSFFDGVSTPRQPGSTLKPFLYALAIEQGWTPATIIEDSPLAQPVRSGLHSFQNYSRTFHGPLRLREALGNSLNTPAVRAIQFTGTSRFLEWLRLLGISGLERSAAHYGQGLALGDGEVSLFELVQAYSVLARRGEFRELRITPEVNGVRDGTGNAAEPPRDVAANAGIDTASVGNRIMDEKTAAVIADILSDPEARRLEFGEGHLLRLPVQTAIKTGTSTDHRDSWAVGFSSSHTVGVWMGNFDRRPTRGVTGAIGPALVMRSVFAELNRYRESRPLVGCPGLVSVGICATTGLRAGPACPRLAELFVPENTPTRFCSLHVPPIHVGDGYDPVTVSTSNTPGSQKISAITARHSGSSDDRFSRRSTAYNEPGKERPSLLQPVPDLELAWDPRIPSELQLFAFKLPKTIAVSRVEWIVNGGIVAETDGPKYLWPVKRGIHLARARVWRPGESEPVETAEVRFTVK